MYEDNGEMRITKTKSTLKGKLQVEHSSRTVLKPDSVIIDGCALLWVIHWPTSGTVTDYARSFTSYVTKLMTDSDVYLVFDRYHNPSIKDVTRKSRMGKGGARRHLLNSHMPLLPQKVTLSVTENKVQLIDILCQHLKDQCHTFPEKNKLVVTSNDPIPFEISDGVIVQRLDMRTTHEEADVIIAQQVVKLAESGNSSIKVVCDDTDVLVLLVHFYAQEQLTCELVMSGTSAGRVVVDIKATTTKHITIADQLLAAHALSGCDTVSQLYGIGKGTVLRVIKSHHTLNCLGKVTQDMDKVIAEANEFISACYGSHVTGDMSSIRYAIWTSKMANKKLTSAPQLKTLPPTTEAFAEHVHRAHFQAAIWREALQPDPPDMNPIHYGWSLDEASHVLDAITLPPDVSPAPLDVLHLIKCGCASEHPCSTARCGCYAAHLSCSMFCACHHGDDRCCNKSNTTDEDDHELVDVFA